MIISGRMSTMEEMGAWERFNENGSEFKSVTAVFFESGLHNVSLLY